MLRVGGVSIRTDGLAEAVGLYVALIDVMAWSAERLRVVDVEEQGDVAAVRLDMIGDTGRHDQALGCTTATERFKAKALRPQRLPLRGLVKLSVFSSLGASIVSALGHMLIPAYENDLGSLHRAPRPRVSEVRPWRAVRGGEYTLVFAICEPLSERAELVGLWNQAAALCRVELASPWACQVQQAW